MVELLIKSGSNVTVTEKNGRNSLHLVSALGGQLGGTLNCIFLKIQTHELTSIFAFIGNDKLIDLIAEKKIDFNAMDKEANTPMHLAATNGKLVLIYLIK